VIACGLFNIGVMVWIVSFQLVAMAFDLSIFSGCLRGLFNMAFASDISVLRKVWSIFGESIKLQPLDEIMLQI
jgi:hypothetical protein